MLLNYKHQNSSFSISVSEIKNKALQKKIDMFYDSMGWTLVDKKNTLERFF